MTMKRQRVKFQSLGSNLAVQKQKRFDFVSLILSIFAKVNLCQAFLLSLLTNSGDLLQFLACLIETLNEGGT